MSEDERRECVFQDDYRGHTYKLENLSVSPHPVDFIEPLPDEELLIRTSDSAYRAAYLQCSKKMLYILNCALAQILEADKPKAAAWQIALACGSGICNGLSMQDIADSLGVTRACLSKGARAFATEHSLPPSNYMRSSDSVKKYREARLDSIEKANNVTKQVNTINDNRN